MFKTYLEILSLPVAVKHEGFYGSPTTITSKGPLNMYKPGHLWEMGPYTLSPIILEVENSCI